MKASMHVASRTEKFEIIIILLSYISEDSKQIAVRVLLGLSTNM